jgi:hypothetical protein
MSRVERALSALRTQLQFELMEAGSEVARTSRVCAQEQAQALTQQQRCRTAAQDWRGAMEQTPINPALLDLLRSMAASEEGVLRGILKRLEHAQQHEALARDALSALHQRSRAIDRALLAKVRSAKQQRQALEIANNDDLWLQRVNRGPA